MNWIKGFPSGWCWVITFIRTGRMDRQPENMMAFFPVRVIVTITALIILILTLTHEEQTRMLWPSRWLGCFRLVCLEFLASFHLHGAVDNPVGSQRLQPLHFHDYHLGSTDIAATCSDSSFERGHGAKKVKSRQAAGKSFQIYTTEIFQPQSKYIYTRSWCSNVSPNVS